MKWKNSMIYLLLAAALIASGICFTGLYKEFHMYKEAGQVYAVFQNEDIEEAVADAAVSKQYQGMIGIIRSKDNLISYPIMQGKDNEYYLTHMANGQAGALGSIFLDCNAKPDFTSAVSVIYGHHVKNEMMFGPLEHYKDSAYYEANKTMELYTADGGYEIDIIAAYLADGSSETYPAPEADEEEIRAFLRKMEDRSFFQNKHEEYSEGKIIILSTCSYEYENARLAVVGVLKRQE